MSNASDKPESYQGLNTRFYHTFLEEDAMKWLKSASRAFSRTMWVFEVTRQLSRGAAQSADAKQFERGIIMLARYRLVSMQKLQRMRFLNACAKARKH